jgi:hypothetical protein
VPKYAKLAADLSSSALVPLATIWAYEISNMIVTGAQGATVSLNVAGFVPLGVAAVSQASLSPLTKLVQVLLSTGMLIPLWVAFSRTRLLIARTFVLAGVSIYLASAYWELLSLLSLIPMVVHESLFIAGTGAIMVPLLVAFADPYGSVRHWHFMSNLRSRL